MRVGADGWVVCDGTTQVFGPTWSATDITHWMQTEHPGIKLTKGTAE